MKTRKPLILGERFMNHMPSKRLTPYAKKLRREMTKEERHLWHDFLKELPVTIHRQKTIDPYIVDFYCASAKLVIELDGSQHYMAEGKSEDAIRDRDLAERGLRVLRYSNLDIAQNFEGVCEDIYRHIFDAPNMPSP